MLANWKLEGGYVPKATTVSRMAHLPLQRFPTTAGRVPPGNFPQQAWTAANPDHVARADTNWEPAESLLIGNWRGDVPKSTTVSRIAEGARFRRFMRGQAGIAYLN